MPSRKGKNYSGVPLYLAGTALWLYIWLFLVWVELHWRLNLFGGSYWPVFVLPVLYAVVTLLVNARLSRNQTPAPYETEIEVIEFVERNSSWFLVGSSAVFAWAALAKDILHLTFPLKPFVIYITLSMMLLCIPILLYWVPYERKPRNLIRLRHWKTVPFTFAVSFFSAAVLTLLLGVLFP